MTLVEGRTGSWETVIGLEVHAQVASDAKLFSGASTAFGAAPNSQVSLVDAAFPGMLPVINRHCVEQAVRTGLGLNARINLRSVFDRKNYFYPDLPAGYQISQYKDPIVGEGAVTVDLADGGSRTVRIERLHLEQDAGKSIHDMDPERTFVDLNRAGVALMEIVSKPDLRSAGEAGAFLAGLRSLLRWLGTCDGNMEEGSLRADVNVSVRRPGAPLGTRCEIKNVNSIRFVRQAIDHEARRQIALLEEGGTVEQETRLFDPDRGETRAMRSKEEAHDYRYFPDPDLLPLELDPAWVEEIRAGLPELPEARKARLMAEYGLGAADAATLVADREDADFFETIARNCRDAKLAVHWVINEFHGRLNKAGRSRDGSPVTAEKLSGLIALIESGEISGRIAKQVFDDMFETGREAAAIVAEQGLRQISDSDAIAEIVDRLIADNPEQAALAKAQPKVVGWFVGQAMKATKGQANPALVNEILRKKLAG